MRRPLFVPLFASTVIAIVATAEVGAQGTTPPPPPPAAAQADPNAPQYISSRGNLSAAVRVGNMLYLSGQLGTDTTRGIQPETAKALQKIKALVEANGSSMDRVVRCTVFLADIAEWGQMNQVYQTFFPAANRPARSAIAVSGMVGNPPPRVEIECMATVK